MTHKTHDLAVKLGTYTDRQGNEKGRWKNVGSVLETDDGGRVLLIDRTFSPAGVPNPENRDNVMISMFEPKDRDQQQAPPQQAPQQTRQPQGGFDDRDVPFDSYMRGSVA